MRMRRRGRGRAERGQDGWVADALERLADLFEVPWKEARQGGGDAGGLGVAEEGDRAGHVEGTERELDEARLAERGRLLHRGRGLGEVTEEMAPNRVRRRSLEVRRQPLVGSDRIEPEDRLHRLAAERSRILHVSGHGLERWRGREHQERRAQQAQGGQRADWFCL